MPQTETRQMDEVTNVLTMNAKYSVEYQTELLPISAVHIHRNDQGSADLQVIVTGSNNKDYAVKQLSDGSGYIPATELFCYELARLIELPTPNYDLILMRDESLAFGSLWEGGVHKISDQNQVIDILTGKKPIRELSRFLSRVYAFDLFINNIDRHFGNYLFRESYNSMIGLAFDYSRAWYEVNAYGYESLEDESTKTRVCHNIIREFKKYDRKAAVETLDKISEIKKADIANLLSKIPDCWLSNEVKDEVVFWWESEHMADRLMKLKGGV